MTSERQRSTLRVLVASNALGGVATASGFAVAALLAENVSGSTSMAGLVATSTTVGAAVLAVPLAGLARSRGRRVSLATGYAIACAGAVLTILAALFSAVAFVLFPFIAGVSVIVQVLVNGLVLLDSMTRTTQRWQERSSR